jgi:hypothetical protein
MSHSHSIMEKVMAEFSLMVWFARLYSFSLQVTAVLWCSANGLNTTIKTESQNFKSAVLLIIELRVFSCVSFFHKCHESRNTGQFFFYGAV